jgi:glucose/arabinose dehydrogenase
MLTLAACSDAPVQARRSMMASQTTSLASSPLAASVTAPVAVPASMRTAPFDVARSLVVPPGFSIGVYARVPGARFMALTPDGRLLVSNPGAGTVALVQPTAGDPVVTTFITGLKNPHDLVFHTIGTTTYLYVTESNAVDRFVYTAGDATGHGRQVIISGLPDASTAELHGAYAHALKNIALDANHKLYVSIASSCNACTLDTQSNPVRGAIYQYAADGTNGRLFARGIRNAEGLAFVPGHTDLWIAVNNRDNEPYPYRNSTQYGYGQVVQSYVDNHPPDEFIRVRDGGDYGWPYCVPSGETVFENMPFDPAVDAGVNDNGQVNCATKDRVTKGINPHSAPLGLTFFHGTNVPSAYRSGAAIALHGSWNRAVQTGYKVAFFPWNDGTQLPGIQFDLVRGWTNGSSAFGRPVDVAVDPQGAILISDDASGTIYKLVSTAPQRVTGLTLINADNAQPIAGYNPIANNATLDLKTLPSRHLSVLASTSPSVVGSVVFAYDNTPSFHVETYPPYDLLGDANGGRSFNPWTPVVGAHTLTATPHVGPLGTGAAGTPAVIHFTVTDQ